MRVYDPRLPIVLSVVALLAGFSLSACSGDDDASAPPTATAVPSATRTPTPTSTSSAEPTATATAGHEHPEVHTGSTEDGGGALAFEFDGGDHLHASFSACLGGEGPECEGGIAVFSTEDPGYEFIVEEEHDLFPLDAGTTVGVEVVAIDEGVSLKTGAEVADAPGESVILGTLPDLEHSHVEYIIALPGGTEDWTKHVTVRLITEPESYLPSEELTLTYREAHE